MESRLQNQWYSCLRSPDFISVHWRLILWPFAVFEQISIPTYQTTCITLKPICKDWLRSCFLSWTKPMWVVDLGASCLSGPSLIPLCLIQKPYDSYNAHVRTAKDLCTSVRDLIILFTRRFISNQDDVDIIREYVEMTIPSVYPILYLFISISQRFYAS